MYYFGMNFREPLTGLGCDFRNILAFILTTKWGKIETFVGIKDIFSLDVKAHSTEFMSKAGHFFTLYLEHAFIFLTWKKSF